MFKQQEVSIPTANIATNMTRITISPLSIVKWEMDIQHSTFPNQSVTFPFGPADRDGGGSQKYLPLTILLLQEEQICMQSIFVIFCFMI